MKFKRIKIEEIKFNPFIKINKKYALVTTSVFNKYNIMTVGWGSIGILWNKNVITLYIRPQRYTRIFLDLNNIFSLSFFDIKYKNILNTCGKLSGYNNNKMNLTNLHIYKINECIPIFCESSLVFICNKIYYNNIKTKNFYRYNKKKYNWYCNKDYHIVYIAEIIDIFKKI